MERIGMRCGRCRRRLTARVLDRFFGFSFLVCSMDVGVGLGRLSSEFCFFLHFFPCLCYYSISLVLFALIPFSGVSSLKRESVFDGFSTHALVATGFVRRPTFSYPRSVWLSRDWGG